MSFVVVVIVVIVVVVVFVVVFVVAVIVSMFVNCFGIGNRKRCDRQVEVSFAASVSSLQGIGYQCNVIRR